jgi:dolichol-phosphate mannosyltransferase
MRGQLVLERSMNGKSPGLLLSIVVPAHNEEQNLEATISQLVKVLDEEQVPFEVIIVDDNSTDGTATVVESLMQRRAELRLIRRRGPAGFGHAVKAGLAASVGQMIIILMADNSDHPRDVIRYYRLLEEGYDCVFGSRFRKGSHVENYPRGKLIANRVVNTMLRALFRTRFNDLTNAFKGYRRHVIVQCGPYSSCHYNLTIELSLSALIRNYRIAEIPINWNGRRWGGSKLSIFKMGRRYLSVVLKIFLDSMLVKDDIMEERFAPPDEFVEEVVCDRGAGARGSIEFVSNH